MNYNKRRLLVAWTAIVIMSGCTSQGKISDSNVQTIEVDELRDLLSDPDAEVVLIDVRPPGQYAKGYIAGAINVPLPKLAGGDARLTEAKQIVVYSQRWDDRLSQVAAKKLLRLQYENVFNFFGGLQLWESREEAVVTVETVR